MPYVSQHVRKYLIDECEFSTHMDNDEAMCVIEDAIRRDLDFKIRAVTDQDRDVLVASIMKEIDIE